MDNRLIFIQPFVPFHLFQLVVACKVFCFVFLLLFCKKKKQIKIKIEKKTNNIWRYRIKCDDCSRRLRNSSLSTLRRFLNLWFDYSLYRNMNFIRFANNDINWICVNWIQNGKQMPADLLSSNIVWFVFAVCWREGVNLN